MNAQTLHCKVGIHCTSQRQQSLNGLCTQGRNQKPKRKKEKNPAKEHFLASILISLLDMTNLQNSKFSIKLTSALFFRTSQDLPNEVKTRGIKLP
jgi:hypothetical protein